MTLQELREEIGTIGLWLEGIEKEVAEMFEVSELRPYFICRDNLKEVIPALMKLEEALYKHKILKK